MKYIFFILSLYITLTLPVLSTTRVMFPLNENRNETRDQYFVELLKLILEETKGRTRQQLARCDYPKSKRHPCNNSSSLRKTLFNA